MKVQITSKVPLHQTPIFVDLQQRPEGSLQLRSISGEVFQTQSDGRGITALISMPAGTCEFALESAPEPESQVTLRESDDQLEILLPDGPFGTYHFGKEAPRPYIWPLYGPDGVEMTRAFPMENRDGEKHDHPHHRSLWTAFDEVNGVNNWHDGEGHGWTRHQKFHHQDSDHICGIFVAKSQWTDSSGEPVLNEGRYVRIYNVGSEARLFDYGISWRANYGDVTFGDTKEAGVIAFRVATSMDGERDGVITNSGGGRGEKECWGRRADWCDYRGQINGETYGITVFSHPDNTNGAPRWHVRDYGLFAANPFSIAAFEGGEKQPFVLKSERSIYFEYRVLLHKGEATERIKQIWDAYSNPPKIEIK